MYLFKIEQVSNGGLRRDIIYCGDDVDNYTLLMNSLSKVFLEFQTHILCKKYLALKRDYVAEFSIFTHDGYTYLKKL